MDDKTLADLKAAHGDDVLVVKTAKGEAAFRGATRSEFKRFQSIMFESKAGKAAAFEYLAAACCVYPDAATFQQWIDAKPGIPLACAGPLNKLAGVEIEEDEKK